MNLVLLNDTLFVKHGDVLTLDAFSDAGHFGVHPCNPVLGD